MPIPERFLRRAKRPIDQPQLPFANLLASATAVNPIATLAQSESRPCGR